MKDIDSNVQEEHLQPAVRAATLWIEDVLKVNLPINTGLRSALASGEILCCLLNTIVPGAIKRINRCPNRAAASDNLTLFLNACETKCGISKSKLFDIDNFEDIFDRNSKRLAVSAKAVKHTEKVVISIFWLAKFVEQEQKFADFPKLDYSAFCHLLPFKSTQSVLGEHRSHLDFSPSTNKQHKLPTATPTANGDQSAHRYSSAPMGNGTSLTVDETAVPISDHQSEDNLTVIRQRSAPTSVPEKNDHTKSTPNQSVASVARPPIFRPASTTVVEQRNNNGMDEDNWQASLDAWRERRRQISLMQAKTLASFEETRQEEERRNQEAARDRLRQIIKQYSIVSNPYASSESQLAEEPISPGLAILTGTANASSDSQGTSRNAPQSALSTDYSHRSATLSPVKLESLAAPTKERETPETKEAKVPHTNGDSHQLTSDSSPSSSANVPNGKGGQTRSNSDGETENCLFSAGDYEELQLRIQSKPKSVEVRWGLTLAARGPSNTAPFVVQYVKIGSTADVCDISRGDILIRVHHTDVSQTTQPGAHKITLQDLEELLDSLSRGGQPIKVHVLRKRSNTEENLDEDNSMSSPISDQPSSPSVSPAPPDDEPSSDVDDHNSVDTALIVNQAPGRAVNSIELVKQISHELKHDSDDQPYSTTEKQSTSNSQKISKACEIEPFVSADSPTEISSREVSSLTQAFSNIPTNKSFTTRI